MLLRLLLFLCSVTKTPNPNPDAFIFACRKMFSKLILAIFVVAVLAAARSAVSQGSCGCSPELCCSQHGYCGNGTDYCGVGCQSGPCYSTTNNVSVADLVTEAFFNGIIGQSADTCAGKGFYARASFIDALALYPKFGKDGSEEDSKREVAAFFAHASHETTKFCFIEEIDGSKKDYCNETNTQYPCVPGKGYYGRGPLQLSWNYNYGPAGEKVGFDGLNSPETVANDPVVSFKAALWFWMTNVHQVIGQGFGATIRAINGDLECNGGSPSAVSSRVAYYTDYCDQFGVSTGENLTC